MTFWIVALVLSAGTLALLLRPLFQGHEAESQPDAADHDIAVYKSQLEELERDLAAGRLTKEEASAARAEIARRLIAADDRRAKAASGGWTSPRAVSIGVVGTLVIGIAFGVYYTTGTPGAPDLPLASRSAERNLAQSQQSQGGANAEESPTSLRNAAANLRARLEEEGGDLDGWLLLGRTEMMQENYAGAAQAFEKAMSIEPDNMLVKSAYGEALVQWANGQITDRAQRIFREVLMVSPNDPAARFYLSEALMQSGDAKGALEGYIALAQDSPADAPWQTALRARAEGLAAQLGIDIAGRLPDPAPAPPALPPSLDNLQAPPGPTQEQMAEAQNMAPEDRQDMIRGMVDGLAAKLEENPMDFQGWMRLIRSRMVLEEPEAAQEALNTALQLFDGAPVPKRMLADAAREFGLALPDGFEMPAMPSGPPKQSADAEEPPPGPTQEDVAAAQEMSSEDRQAMIEGMVAQLAERLETETPDDIEGWIRLARSYDVLRQEEKALDALVNAAAAAERLNHPDLEAILLDQGRLRRTMAGNAQTPESVDLMRRVEALNPNNVEALWFLGLAAVGAQDRQTAISYFNRALDGLPEGAPEREALAAEVERLTGGGTN